MYPVSADFHNLSIADAPTSRVRIYFIEANVDCTDDNDVQSNGTLLCMPGETDSNGRIEKGGVTINEFFNSDTNVQIGATVSSQIGMTLINRDGALDGFNYGRCKVYIDVYDDTNSTWLTCPMGVYNIAIPKRRKVQLVSATGYDQMQQLDEIADSWWNGLDWSNGITLLQIIQSMAATLGIHLSANTSANIVNSGLSYTEIPFTAIEMTYRDILSYIAETTGTIARFDRNGALDLRWFSDAVLSTDTQTYAGGLVTFTATDRASISSLSVPFSPIQDLHGYDHPWPAGGGVNIFDEEMVIGAYNSGVPTVVILPNDTTHLRSKNPISVTPETTYYMFTAGYTVHIEVADDNGNVLWRSVTLKNGTFTTPVNGTKVYFNTAQAYGTTYNHDIAINYPSTVTTYSPYANICPITGRTGVTVWDDPKHGGLIDWNQQIYGGNFEDNTLWARLNASTVLTIAGNECKAEVTTNFGGFQTSANNVPVENRPTDLKGHKYYIRAEIKTSSARTGTVGFGLSDSSSHYKVRTTVSTDTEYRVYAFIGSQNDGDVAQSSGRFMSYDTAGGEGVTLYVKNVFACDLTQMFGEGNEPTTVEQFRALFPKEYYAYNSGTTTCVSAVNGDPYWKKDIDWTSPAGTVYGGTLDVVSGVLTVDRATVTFNGSETWGAGSPISGQGCYTALHSLKKLTDYKSAISCNELKTYSYHNAPEYVDTEYGITGYRDGLNKYPGQNWIYIKINGLSTTAEYKTWLASNNLQVVYTLATPLTYQLTPQEVAALVGTNNVWSTGDSVSVTVSEPTLVEIQTDTVGNQCLSIDVGEYQVSQIDALSVKASQADVGVTIGSGGNAYTILDNPMLFGDEAAITTKATPIYNRLSAFRLFTPISMRCIMDWSIEAGDIITVTNESVTYDLPIFQQRLRWRGGYVVSDLFSNGEQERPTQSKEIRSSFRSKTQMHEFEVTLEQLRSYIQSVDGNYTLIQQTVDAITKTVANQNVTIQNIIDPTGEIWTAITKNTSNLSSIEDSLNNEITERRSYIRFIPSEPAIVMGVDEDNEIKLKLVNNIIYFFNGADDSTDLSLAYAYFNSQEAFADRFVAGESVQIGTNDNAAHWLWKKLNNGDLVLELVG